MIKEAIVLAGGLGTRLRSEVKDVPKPMAPVNEKPFLFYVLKYLVDQGVERIILSVGYLSESIVSYFGHAFGGAELVYIQEDTPLGTGGGVKLAVASVEQQEFLLVNGDTFFNADLNDLSEELTSRDFMAIISLKEMKNPDRYGTVTLKNGEVVEFKEKQKGLSGGLINAGVYALNKEVFNGFEKGQKFSLETAILEPLSKQGKLGGIVFDGYFIDIGIPEDYQKANKEYDRLGNNA